ncbi:MAG: divalent-cation tolerance protein CutA [Acidobacteria bacterium]|nr:divalent-cation tolerance protein CutA [Acidobacteriota bacterium]
MTDKVIVFATCPSREEAKRIARGLVEERLAACVNVVDGILSIYQWQGSVHEGDEVMLVAKSRRDLLSRLLERLASMHSYEVPEAIAIQVVDGWPAYLEWLDRELSPPEI